MDAARKALLIAALALQACAQRQYATDGEGYAMPSQCRADPTAYRVPVVEIDEMAALPPRVQAYYHKPSKTIGIKKNLTGWRREDSLRHEFAHAYCHETKDPCCSGHFAPLSEAE